MLENFSSTKSMWFLSIALLVTGHFTVGCEGFQPQHANSCSSRQVFQAAKPSPKSGFDLESIEAFESKPEELEQQKNALDHVDDDGDDEDEIDMNESSANVQILVVPTELHNKRIDTAISTLMDPELSRSVCGNLVLEGRVQRILNNDEAGEVIDRKSFKVESGMTLRVFLPEQEKPTEIRAQDLALDILFEDEHMIVLNKAAHMVVHPAPGNWDGTVVNALAYYLPRSSLGHGEFVGADGTLIVSSISSAQQMDALKGQSVDGESATAWFRPGICHRLDKGTSGCLVVAKTSRALSALSNAFAGRRVSKTYLAVTVGNPGHNVKIDKPIGRHPIHRQRMRVVPDPHQKNSRNRLAPPPKKRLGERAPSVSGRHALSYVDTLAFDGKLGLVRVKIETGRTHQIRVHLQDRHTPIYGDDVYGLSDWNKRLLKAHQIDRPLLHAYKLSLEHPITGEPMEFTAPLDSDIKCIAETIVPPDQDLSDLLNWTS